MKPHEEDTRRPVRAYLIGAGRGAERRLPQIAGYNEASKTIRLDPVVVDPVPGKAVELARRGQGLGLEASPHESSGEPFLESGILGPGSPIIVAIDDARAITRILEAQAPNTLFIYNVMELPGVGLTGLMFVVSPEDVERKAVLSQLFHQLASVIAPSGSREVLGEDSPVVNRLSEGMFRKLFESHFNRNVARVIHGLAPETAPLLVTFDGRTTHQMEILEQRKEWRSEEQLFEELEASLTVPIRPGTDFAVVELGLRDIRFHQIRFRFRDRRFGFTGTSLTQAEARPGPSEDVKPASRLSHLAAALLSD